MPKLQVWALKALSGFRVRGPRTASETSFTRQGLKAGQCTLNMGASVILAGFCPTFSRGALETVRDIGSLWRSEAMLL